MIFELLGGKHTRISVIRSSGDVKCCLPAWEPIAGKNKKSLLDLAVKQGLNGGWEFAKLSFPR